MMLKKKILLSLLILSIYNNLFSQVGWKIVWKSWEVADTVFSIDEKKHNEQNGYLFPEFFHEDKVEFSAPFVLENEKFSNINLNKNIHSNLDSTFLRTQFYTENIDSLCFRIYIIHKNIILQSMITINNQGYLIPTLLRFSDFEIDSISDRTDINKRKRDRLHIEVFPSNEKQFKIAFKELLIFTNKSIEVEVRHPFLNDFFTYSSNSNNYSEEKKDNSPLLFENDYPFSNSVGSRLFVEQIEERKDKYTEKELLYEFYNICLKHYPFYEEKKLDKSKIFTEYKNLEKILDSLSLEKLVTKLDEITNKFDDGHFKIIVNKQNNRSSNRNIVESCIALYDIKYEIYIAGVFDQELKANNLIGKKIEAIDGIPVNNYIDSLMQNHGWSREYSVKTCLNRSKGTLVRLTYLIENSDKQNEIILSNTKKRVIPEKYIPKHCEFKILNDIAYFKINKFDLGVYLKFINNYEKLKTTKGLIIDLRNNGGGESLEAMRLFSVFIDKPLPYSHNLDFYGNWETLVIKENPNYNFDHPIVIIINDKTACASEAFAIALKENKNATIIGKNSSGGAYASLYEINFPSNFKIKTNILGYKSYVVNKQEIENIGIEPDIYVKINKVKDLYPFNDIILERALMLFNH